MLGNMNQRVGLKVQFVASSSHTAAGCAIHFFQATGQGQRAGGKPSKKLLCLVDRKTFLADVETAVNRCVMISKIEMMAMYQEDARPLMEAMTQYEIILQRGTYLDFVRTIGAIFKPGDPGNPTPMYELEENQNPAVKVNVRLSRLALDDTFSKQQSDEVVRRLRDANSREVSLLKTAMQKQKDDTLHELVDLHTQNEQLRHTLGHTENMLIETKRQSRDQSIGLLSQNEMLSAELEGRYSVKSPPTRVAEPLVHGFASPSVGTPAPPMPPSPRGPTTGMYTPDTGPGFLRSPGSVRSPPPRDIHPRYASPIGARPPSQRRF
eukprot:TRINITY_DN362_c13_g1_i1.p1 TRINITY_DN362_c13_g1~~TRINITY_DN362_c13_g1_i1.p1  ORF type:complete len:322 (+),score=63.77 TRINITY_DN362_c13_g1_i1:97-1062(+)